jgi:hypothetical protein
MRILVQSNRFRESIANSEDRNKFDNYFSGLRSIKAMPLLRVTLPEAKTLTQLGTIWLDFTTVSGFMHCEPSYIYYQCLRAESLRDIWLQEKDGDWHFSTLSGLTKEQASAAIPRLRDFMQKIVNDAYGEWMPIIWASKENLVNESGCAKA